MRKVIKGRLVQKNSIKQNGSRIELQLQELGTECKSETMSMLRNHCMGERELQAGYHSCNVLQEKTWKMLFIDCEAGLELG